MDDDILRGRRAAAAFLNVTQRHLSYMEKLGLIRMGRLGAGRNAMVIASKRRLREALDRLAAGERLE